MSEERRSSYNNISNCNIVMNLEAEGATKSLAEALLAQAKANESNSKAMLALAQTLKPMDICAIKVENVHDGKQGEIL